MELSLEPWKVALASSVLGGTFTLIGQLFSNLLAKRSRIAQDSAEMKSLLQSYYAEIETLHELYMGSVGNYMKEKSFPNGVDVSFLAEENYMTVFDNNAHQIGKIRNDALRKAIIEAYTTAKSLLDTYKSNKTILQRIFELQLELAKHPGSKEIIKFIELRKESLKKYSVSVIHVDQKYQEKVSIVLSLLQSEMRR